MTKKLWEETKEKLDNAKIAYEASKTATVHAKAKLDEAEKTFQDLLGSDDI